MRDLANHLHTARALSPVAAGTDNTNFTAVDDAYLTGTEVLASFQFDDDNETRKIGYVGTQRYLRATITPANNAAGNIFVAAIWILGKPNRQPTANPPQ